MYSTGYWDLHVDKPNVMTNTCPFHSFMVYFIKSRQTVIIPVRFIQNWLYSDIFLISKLVRNKLVITYTLYVNICLYLNALSTTLLVNNILQTL